jgi:hypothetical protein
MPFGKKPGAGGALVDFDSVYEQLIAPAIRTAELDPLRADEEMTGGIIHKPMYERLILCEFAVADLTTANANVFYELGLRHAVRPWSTVLLFAEGSGQLPFDVGPLRALPYRLGPDGKPADLPRDWQALTARLQEARAKATDSPVFQLVEHFPDIQRLKTDVFRDRVHYSEEMKTRLAAARKAGVDAVRAMGHELGKIPDAEAGVVIDLFLSYRAVKAWADMIALVKNMTPPLAATVMVQEQLGLALNRAGPLSRLPWPRCFRPSPPGWPPTCWPFGGSPGPAPNWSRNNCDSSSPGTTNCAKLIWSRSSGPSSCVSASDA